MHTDGQVALPHLPVEAFHPASHVLRAIALAALLVLAWLSGVSVHRTLQREAELSRYRSVIQGLTSTVRAMRSQAAAKRCPIQLSIDASHGAFQLVAIRRGSHHRSYETVERTLWLPEGLQISDGPSTLTALPNGRLSPATIVVTAPAYQRLFRLTTQTSGVVQLDEEPTL